MIIYMCPHCGTPSEDMMLLEEEEYKPTILEIQEKPEFWPISSEVLQCTCGRHLNWWDMLERKV